MDAGHGGRDCGHDSGHDAGHNYDHSDRYAVGRYCHDGGHDYGHNDGRLLAKAMSFS